MARGLFSPQWYRVAELKPRLRTHAAVHRQVFRSQVWYVLDDHVTGRFHRISAAAWQLVGMMNGRRSVDQIWRTMATRLGDDLPTQDATIQLLARLHQADALVVDMPPDIAEVTRRGEQTRRTRTLRSFRNPLAIRVPLIDPDRFLGATLPLVRPLLGPAGALLWMTALIAAVVLAALEWQALTAGVADRVLSAGNLVLLLLIYPVIKALHELGHGYMAKRWGGEVHEIGVMLLVFLPVPYVEASSASAFTSKWRRAAVGAAGIGVELFLAALAMILWTQLEPGLTRSILFNVMLLTGVSTLLFNGNPLLRFDGYYVLSDLIEIPNLGLRANQYLTYLAQRYLFGMRDAVSPATAPGERVWFVVYGIAAAIYRVFIMSVILLFVAGQFFEIGLLLALWVALLVLAWPVAKGAWFLLASPKLETRRGRALAVTGGGLAALAGAIMAVPLPHATMAEGVVWLPERAIVHAGTAGFIAERLADDGAQLAAGQPILRLEEPLLDARLAVLDARLAELTRRHRAAVAADRVGTDRVAAGLVAAEQRLVAEELAQVSQQRGRLAVEAPQAGRLILPDAVDLPGRFVAQGATLAYVVAPGDPSTRVVVTEADINLVQARTEAVAVRFVSRPEVAFEAHIVSGRPAATRELPGLALSREGGGTLHLDPTADQVRTLEQLFLFDLRTDAPMPFRGLGERVHVRFDHGTEPVGLRLWRRLRQLFLARLDA